MATDLTWSDSAVFACPCGALYPATHWRWIDVVVRSSLADRVARFGPYEGICPSCGRPPRASATWLAIDSRARTAALRIPSSRRGQVIDELQAHLAALGRRDADLHAWLLQPKLEWSDPYEGSDLDAIASNVPINGAVHEAGSVPLITGAGPFEESPLPGGPDQPLIDLPGPVVAANLPGPTLDSVSRAPMNAGMNGGMSAGVPQLIGPDIRTPPTAPPPSLGAFVTGLELDDPEGPVRVRLQGDTMPADAMIDRWVGAKLDIRPVHLRGYGYPLCGVRVIASYFGQRGVIDALIDPGSTEASEVFRLLSRRFAFELQIGDGTPRALEAPGLEPNAALCLESARGLLAQGEYPLESYEQALERLRGQSVPERMRTPEVTLAPDAYRHIVGAREAISALEHLDRVSQKDHLSRLLEVEGLLMADYDAIRRRVLAGSLEHGLVAPRRFWRRVVASGLVANLEEYATRLADRRAACEGTEGDLDPGQAQAAWEGIFDLCERKGVPPPVEVRRALGLPDGHVPPAEDLNRRAVAGEIIQETVAGPPPRHPVLSRLRDPRHRLKMASEVLRGEVPGIHPQAVFEALDEFDTDELLALMPDLSELGVAAVPGLLPKLESDRREVRQTAAILLGLACEPGSLVALCSRLVREPTSVWLDVARSIGGFGLRAIAPLGEVLERDSTGPRRGMTVERVARALAEIALSQGVGDPGSPGPGRSLVATLAEGGDRFMATAARRALATLRDVSQSRAAIRGELPLSEETEIRGFARRAYEAITVPEVEVEAEA